MRLKALSYYDGDKETRYGDCILLYSTDSLIVYDCGHARHVQEVENFLTVNSLISQVYIVVSHNDSDHTDGIIELLEYLYNEQYTVTVYSSLYLKSTKKVLDILDDERRTLPATKERILKKFDKIRDIVEKAQKYGFAVKDATVNAKVAMGTIVGPTEDEFVEVVAQAIEYDRVTIIEGETVMNAASIQLKCDLEDGKVVLLCGDASPSYLYNLDGYEIIQLPHHGQLDDAVRVFEKLKDSYSKTYLVSDNTGSSATSGGSDKLVEYMQEEYYTPALNTKNGVVDIPAKGFANISIGKPQGVKLGEMDSKYR